MRILFVLLFLLTTSVQSNTLPTKEGNIFWDENLQESHEGTNFKVGLNNSAGHLGVNGHNILSVLHDNKYLFTPDFPVGIIDAGFYTNHEDFHDYIQNILPTTTDTHGTSVLSLFSSAEVQNFLGIHGIINAVSYIGDYSDELSTNLSNYQEYSELQNVKVITQSMTLEYCTSYRAVDENHECWSGGAEYNLVDMVNHVEALAPVRQHFIDNPDTLFVLSAGNESVDASWMNGAVHYRYVAAEGVNPETVVFEPLDNLLVVAAVGYGGVLHNYSDYGESVDLAVISGVLAARCVDENGSYYAADDTEDGYGIYRQNSDLGNSGAPCDSTGHGNGNNAFNGTSAAAPIAAGMSALLLNMDLSMSPAQVKTLLTQNSSKATSRYTGTCDENDVCDTQSLSETSKAELPIPNLFDAYTQLKIDIELQVDNDISSLANLTREINQDSDCVLLWNDGTSTRKVIGSDKSYEAKFYGDRCLYFRGNSFIIDYDLETRTASKLYYNTVSHSKYREYMTFRHFVNNLKSAKADETWRNGYGVILNSSGNVGCTVADNCINGKITTAQQCENMFTALTGVSPSVMNARSNLLSNGICEFRNLDDANIATMYNSTEGSVEKIDFRDYLEQDRFTLEQYLGNNIPTDVQACIATWNSSGISRNLNDTVVDLYGYDVLYYKGDCYYKSKFNDQTIVIDTRGENVEVVVNNSKIFEIINRWNEMLLKLKGYYIETKAVVEYNQVALSSVTNNFFYIPFDLERYARDFDYLSSVDVRNYPASKYGFLIEFISSLEGELDSFYTYFWEGGQNDLYCPEGESWCNKGINDLITVEYPIH